MNDTPPNSENVVVVQDEQSGLKGIQGVENVKGKVEFPIVLSSRDFEFTVETIFNDSTQDLSFFFTKGEQNLSFEITGGGSFSLEGEPRSRSDSWQSHAKNTVRFVVSNDIASLFVNEVFLKKVTLSDDKHNVMFDNLIVINIEDKNTIYSMNLANGIFGSAGSAAAELSGDLVNLHIPQVNFNASEGVKKLWADLRLYPNTEGKILFEVIDYGDYPK